MNALSTYDELAVVDDPDDRMNSGWLEALLKDIAQAPRLMVAIQAAAAAHPARLSVGSLKRKYYAWKRQGTAALVDQRKLRRLGKAHTWVECFMTYCENHNRSNRGSWRVMLSDLWAGKVLPHGVGDWREVWRTERTDVPVPDHCPEGWIPKRARYENLQKALKKNPDYRFQIIAGRQGRKAAHEFLLPVLKTRRGLRPGQVIECDDVHVDIEVVMPGVGRIARPQMFVGYDIASGFKAVDTVRPQYATTKGGKRDSLKEAEFRMLNAYLLTGVGFHKDGCRIVVEHGTTAIRPTLERRIKSIPHYGCLINYERSGILAEAVHAGMFKGDGGGNFRMKPYCEKAHSIEHSRRAMLPGQVGKDADHRPESHAALANYDQNIMNAVLKLPAEKRELIMCNLCDWQTFVRLNYLLTDTVMDDPDHRMEGWSDNRVVVWRLSDTDEWKPVSALYDMGDDQQRDAVLAFLQAHPEHRGNRRMTRREVWNSGKADLVRVPLFELPLLLDPDKDARVVRVKKDGTFGFSDQYYYGQDEIIYHAACRTRLGFRAALIPGREYIFYGTPYHTDAGVIVDPESGKVIGLAPVYTRAPIYDREAIIRAAGKQNEDLARKMMPFRGRHQQEAEQRLALIGRNADVLSGRLSPAKELPLDNVTVSDGDGEIDTFDDDIPDAIDEAAMAFTPANALV